jgi:hypothetical protein
MTPFQPEERDLIRRNSNWSCTSCGKSSFDKEKWLIEATHNVHKDDSKGGEAHCRGCHLLKDLEMGDMKSVNRIANRIWNTGLRHWTEYVKNPFLMRQDRLWLTEMLSGLEISGQVHIKEKVSSVNQLKDYVAKQMQNVRKRKY